MLGTLVCCVAAVLTSNVQVTGVSSSQLTVVGPSSQPPAPATLTQAWKLAWVKGVRTGA